MPLPIETYLPRIVSELRGSRRLILSAAPGAGKTTCVPPELMKLTDRRIILVEPRRVAARAAAARISELLGDAVGGVAGYQVRGDRAASRRTRILAVTPGIMLNRLQNDPLMEEAGAVIVDEFHERQWECDLALSFIDDLERSAGKRLFIVVMSATADTAKLAEYLPDAAPIDVPGKLFPVEVRWSEETPEPRSVAGAVAKATLRMLRETSGDLLVFLPGAGEISAAAGMLESALSADEATVLPLYGDLPLERQLRALAPDPRGRRKLVLATNVAESSLTIDGITAVIDSGYERRMVCDHAAGMSFLKLVKITRASADQRAGRAGRTAPGVALRLWSRFDHAARREHAVPEILRAELAPLLLEVFAWGGTPEKLRWLDPPPEAALAEAEKLLVGLGALDDAGHLTAVGRRLAGMPLHPRLGAMLLRAERLGALDAAIDLAALLEERAPTERRTADISTLRPSREAARLRSQLRQTFGGGQAADVEVSPGLLLATAFPDWIARRREPGSRSYRLAGGRAARLAAGDDLERCEFLAVARLGGDGGSESVIRMAAPLEKAELEKYFASAITTEKNVAFNPDTGRASARMVKKFGELILGEGAAGAVDPAELTEAVLRAARERGIEMPPPDTPARRFLDRVRFARRSAPGNYPDWGPDRWPEVWTALAAAFPLRGFADLERLPWPELLRSALGRENTQRLDREFPQSFRPPRGAEVRIDYSEDTPTVAIRIQALYTLDEHPCIGPARLPLKLKLLSPASRPVQITGDLPGFWRGSWKLVRKEMKSRYPKHLWPEDPLRPAD